MNLPVNPPLEPMLAARSDTIPDEAPLRAALPRRAVVDGEIVVARGGGLDP